MVPGKHIGARHDDGVQSQLLGPFRLSWDKDEWRIIRNLSIITYPKTDGKGRVVQISDNGNPIRHFTIWSSMYNYSAEMAGPSSSKKMKTDYDKQLFQDFLSNNERCARVSRALL
jgi:hypothetical protein